MTTEDERRVRQLPAASPRVETGPVRFGDDWSGLYVRGDDCMALAVRLRGLLQRLPQDASLRWEAGALGELLELLEGTREGDA